MMSLWDALRMNMMISYQELVRTFPNDLRMQLKGNTSTINGETVLSTNITGLGIRIENSADNSLFAVGENSWTPFNINNQPQLKAVPVKASGAQLAAGEFNASLTMVVDYQ